MLCDQRVQHNGARDGRDSDVCVSWWIKDRAVGDQDGSGSMVADYMHHGLTGWTAHVVQKCMLLLQKDCTP
jgi:hypothetical protein